MIEQDELAPEITKRTSRAKAEWHGQLTEHAIREAHWRNATYLCAFGMLVFGCWACYLGTLPKNIPYLVERSGDRVFYAAPVKPRSMDAQTWDLVKVESLKRFITEWRTVTTDRTAQDAYWDAAYLHVGKGSPAKQVLDEWYGDNNPSRRAGAEVVSVEYKTYDKRGDNTYWIWWIETTRDLRGAIKSQKTWQATFPTIMKIPSSEQAREENGLGITIVELSFHEVL